MSRPRSIMIGPAMANAQAIATSIDIDAYPTRPPPWSATSHGTSPAPVRMPSMTTNIRQAITRARRSLSSMSSAGMAT